MKVMSCLVVAAIPLIAGLSRGQATLTTAYGTFESRFGRVVVAAGDIDGDGVSDVIAGTASTSSNYNVAPFVRVLSGATGATLHQWPAPSSTGVGGCGDVNQDGVPDIVIGTEAQIRSGATGFPIRALAVPVTGAVGEHVGCPGDVDGDTVPDVALSATNDGDVILFSGATGAVIRTLDIVNTSASARIAVVADIDGDGIAEILTSRPHANPNNSVVRLFSGGTGAQLRQWAGLGANFGSGISDAGDVDGDGVPDLAIGYEDAPHPHLGGDLGAVHVYSGLTGQLIREIHAPSGDLTNFGINVALLGDLNGDGFRDLGVTASPHFSVICGASGAEVMRVPADAHTTGGLAASSVAFLPDADGDGVDDFVLGSTFWTQTESRQGRVAILSGRIYAVSAALPVSCAGGPFPPSLLTSRAVLGSTLVLAGQNAVPGSTAYVVWSQRTLLPVSLGFPGCDAWVDLSAMNLLATFAVPPTGTWTLATTLPATPQLAGTVLHVQAAYSGTPGPLGFDLGNGVMLRLGH